MIAENLVNFARILRQAGLPVTPDRMLAATAALEAVGVARRDDVHAALSAVMLDRHEQQVLFDAAFEAFWRDPKLVEELMMRLLPTITGRSQKKPEVRANRLAQALAAPSRAPSPEPRDPPQPKNDAHFTFSHREKLQRADFETMTVAEFELAKKIAEQMDAPAQPVRRRRHQRALRGALDLRRSMLRMVRNPDTLTAAFSKPRIELPPLVVLLDISGSMDRYARILLHYAHGLTRRHVKVQTFTFGTRLTPITRCLKNRDPDVALQLADQRVRDWKGGTRIASCLAEFNQHWGRRVLGSSAAVLLVTDGLDGDEQGNLAPAAAQLRRMAHQIVWLNPLLRFEGYRPEAPGVRALLPNVDRCLPVHNLNSLADLARALSVPLKRQH